MMAEETTPCRKILFAVDASEEAEKALYCGDSPAYDDWTEIWEREQAKKQEITKKYEKILKDNNIRGHFDFRYSNNPGEVIVQAAREAGAELIGTGSRGLGRIRRTVLGSVSDYVLHHAHCPVFIYRHE